MAARHKQCVGNSMKREQDSSAYWSDQNGRPVTAAACVWGGRGYISTTESLGGGNVQPRILFSIKKVKEISLVCVCVYLQSTSTWLGRQVDKHITLFQKTLLFQIGWGWWQLCSQGRTWLWRWGMASRGRWDLRELWFQRIWFHTNLLAGGGDQEQWSQFQARPGHCPGM